MSFQGLSLTAGWAAGTARFSQSTSTASSRTAYGFNGGLMTGWVVDLQSPVTLGWDEYNGRLTQSAQGGLAYDLDGRLQRAQAGTVEVAVGYDPAGNRVSKQVSDDGSPVSARRYILDTVGDLPVVLLEIDAADSSLTTSYYYAAAQPLSAVDQMGGPATALFYLHDRLGSVRLAVGAGGQAAHRYAYDPFGRTLESFSAFDAPANPLRFTGQWYDDETSQYHLRARMYDPTLMRFTTRDPVKGYFTDPLTLHRYLYCWNNPVNLVDLNGAYSDEPWWKQMEFWSEFGSEIIKGAAAAFDGFNPFPFWNPLEYVYANSDGSIDSVYLKSRLMGSASRTALCFAMNSWAIQSMFPAGGAGGSLSIAERLVVGALWKGTLVNNTFGNAAGLTWGAASAILGVAGAADNIVDWISAF